MGEKAGVGVILRSMSKRTWGRSVTETFLFGPVGEGEPGVVTEERVVALLEVVVVVVDCSEQEKGHEEGTAEGVV